MEEVTEVTLSPFWILTMDHRTASDGRPVLINDFTGKAHGPADLIQVYPFWNWQPARDAVTRMASAGKFTKEEMDFINKF